MNLKFGKQAVLALAVAAYLPSAFAVYGNLDEFRCAADQITGTTGVAEAKSRLAWAWKCVPDQMKILSWRKEAEKNTKTYPTGVAMVYPVFGVDTNEDAPPTILKAPRDGEASCDWLQKIMPGAEIKIIGYCGVGCLTGDQLVEFGEGEAQIGSKDAARAKTVVTLQEGAQLGGLLYRLSPLRQIVSDIEPKKQSLLKFVTASGKSIQVTPNHPLVDQQGRVRRADQFVTGDSLVHSSGELDAISKIEPFEIVGKVYNVKVDSEKIEENIYIAQGFLNGSSKLQNEYVRYLNRQLLRRGRLLNLEGV